jgi:polyisoprenoid-binding protein YceI
VLRTFRQGVAAKVGHDLTIDLLSWSATVTVSDDDSPEVVVEVQLDLTSLSVRDGVRGVKPLTDSDRKDIAKNAAKTLETARYPNATFTSRFTPKQTASAGDVADVSGELTLHGSTRPLALKVSVAGEDRYSGSTTIVQSDFGIRPYTGFFGALKVRDAVDVEFETDLSG